MFFLFRHTCGERKDLVDPVREMGNEFRHEPYVKLYRARATLKWMDLLVLPLSTRVTKAYTELVEDPRMPHQSVCCCSNFAKVSID